MKIKLFKIGFLTQVILLAWIAAVFSTGCASTPAPAGQGKPSWVLQYPKDNAYYVGIGSSSTGNQSDDTELAKARALNSVAAEISTEIKSSTSYREVDDGQGGVSRSAEEEISAVVAQNLQAVETMDSWYSAQDGAWYYVRLNKAQWAAIQKKEMDSLSRRVLDLVTPAVKDNNKSVSEVLTALAGGWKILAPSPYAGMIRAELNGQQGVLIDLLENQIAAELGASTIAVEPSEISLEVGRPARLSVRVTHEKRTRPGQLTVDMVNKGGEGDVVFSMVTSPMGTFSDPVSLSGLGVGKNYIAARLNLETLGFPPGLRVTPPQKDILMDLQQLKTVFSVTFGGDVEDLAALGGVEGTARAFFTTRLPVKIVSPSEGGSFDIRFQLQYRNAPPNDYGLVIIYVKANVSVIRGGKTLYTYETGEYKGGGLNWSQANSKALDILFPVLENDSRFLDEITGAFALD